MTSISIAIHMQEKEPKMSEKSTIRAFQIKRSRKEVEFPYTIAETARQYRSHMLRNLG